MAQFCPWFKFSFLLFQTHYHVIIIHYHTQKQKKRKFEPRIKLNYNSYTQMNPYTAISRKVVRKNVHAAIPKGNMGYDQHTVPNDCSCRTYFCCFPLALANRCPWPLVPFFQISLENRADKTNPQYFSGLSRALFPTTFLETAVYPSFISKIQLVVYYQCCVLIG